MSPEPGLARLHRARRIGRRLITYILDLAAFALSTFLAFELRFDGALPAQYIRPMEAALCIWAGSKTASYIVGAVNRGSWRHTSVSDAVRIVVATSAGSILGGFLIFLLLGPRGIPRSIYLLDWLISWVLTAGARFAVCMVLTERSRSRTEGERTRTLIYGAGDAGLALLWELRQNQSLMCDVVGFVDDDPMKGHLILQGKRVFGNGRSSRGSCPQACHQESAHSDSLCDGAANGAHIEVRHRCQGGIQDGAKSG